MDANILSFPIINDLSKSSLSSLSLSSSSLVFIINIVTSVQTTISSTSNNTRMYIILYAHRIGITRVNNLQPSINKCRTSNTEEATIKHSNLDHISKNTFQWQYKLININNLTSVTSSNNGETTFNQIALSITLCFKQYNTFSIKPEKGLLIKLL